MDSGVELRLLGRTEFVGPGERRLVGWESPGPERLVVALVGLTPGTEVGHGEILEALRGGEDVDDGAYRRLTARLEARLNRLLDGRPLLRNRTTGLTLDLAPDQCDVARYLALASRARESEKRAENATARRLVDQAEALVRGIRPPLIPALADNPVAARRLAWFSGLRLDALAVWAASSQRLGRHEEVAARLAELGDETIESQALSRERMLALHRSGRQQDALDVFRRLEERLGASGSAPDEDVQELRRRIVAGDRALAWIESSGPVRRGDGAAVRAGEPASSRGWRKEFLGTYLDHLRFVCDQLPYATLREGAPHLSDVYVQAGTELATDAFAPAEVRSAESDPLAQRGTLELALQRHRNLVLEAGPGMGKSSLLNVLAIDLIDREQSPSRDLLVPIRVAASSEALRDRPLLEGIVAAMAEESGQATSGWPVGTLLHDRPPFPNARWLVLVDGLDELIDPGDRQQLVERIRQEAASLQSRLRFVVATRPSADIEKLREERFGHYRLMAFDRQAVERFARRWFEARKTSRRNDETAFLERLRRTQIADLGRVPLLLTMAVLIFEEDRGSALPRGRAALYERFLRKLDVREREVGTLEQFTRDWREVLGEAGAATAEDLFRERRRLVERVAAEDQAAGGVALVEATTRRLLEREPRLRGIDVDWVRRQSLNLLQRTGVVVERPGGAAFVHATFREYLAASALVGEAGERTEDLSDRIAAAAADPGQRQFVLFALAILSDAAREVSDLVRRIRKLSDGLLLAGASLAEGVAVAPDLQAEIVADLVQELKTSMWGQLLFVHPNALETLESVKAAMDVLPSLLDVVQAESADTMVRIAAAESLATTAWADRVQPILRAIMLDGAHRDAVRLKAAVAIARMGDGREALETIQELVLRGNESAAEALTSLGNVGILSAMAADERPGAAIRQGLAASLARQGEYEPARQVLLTLLRDAGTDPDIRGRCLSELGRYPNYADDLRAVVQDRTLPGWVRELGAEALARLVPRDTGQMLADIASDVAEDERVQVRAVAALGASGEFEHLWRLAQAAGGPSLVRLRALEELAADETHREHVRSTLIDIGDRAGAPAEVAMLATAQLGAFGEVELAAPRLAAMAAHGGTSAWVREEAVLALGRLRCGRELSELLHDDASEAWLRAAAAATLTATGLGGAEVVRPLRAVAASTATPDWVREWADRLIKGLGP